MYGFSLYASIDRFTDTAAILISIVAIYYCGMLRGQRHINLPPGYPIMFFEAVEIGMASVSAKRSITYYYAFKEISQCTLMETTEIYVFLNSYMMREWKFSLICDLEVKTPNVFT